MVSQQTSFPTELSLHTLFRDRYFIISKIGAGGFGSVYKATDRQNGDRLATLPQSSMAKHKPLRVLISTA